MNLSQQLVAEFTRKITSGLLPAGSKLPSIRQEASLRGISPTTMAEVYDLLRSRGFILSRPRSGFFVAPPSAPLTMPADKALLLPSESLKPADLLQDMVSASHDERIVPFGAAIPRAQYYPLNALKRISAQLLREDPALLGMYRFPPGSIELRQQLARRYQRFDVSISDKDMVTTTGAIESVSLALGVIASPGDTIAIETPTYPGIFYLVRSLGYRIMEIPMHASNGLGPAALEQAIRASRKKLKALITVPNFSNPLGSLVSDADKQALVELATDNQVMLIEDDIYGDMSFSRKRPRPLKAFDNDDRVILCTSFSKTISPGLRSGTVINARLAEQLHAIKYARGSGISALNEAMLCRYLQEDNYDRHLHRSCQQFQTLVGQYSQLILQNFPAGTRLSQPRGGFLLWIELPHAIDGNRLQKDALRSRISIAPGSVFSNQGTQYRNFIRLNCALPFNQASQRAVRRLAKLIREQEQT